jgi:hypothetical protein
MKGAGAALVVLILTIASPAGAQAPREVIADGPYRLYLSHVPNGLMIDFDKHAPSAPASRLSLARSGDDLTDKARFFAPLVKLTYVMDGISSAQQCRIKALLDVISGVKAKTYSNPANAACPNPNFFPGSPAVPTPYMRLVEIHVTGGAADAPEPDFRRLILKAEAFDDREAVSRRIRDFLTKQSRGLFIVVPKDQLGGIDPLVLTLFNGGEALGFYRVDGGLGPWRMSIKEAVAAGASLLILLIILFLLGKLFRREKPLNSVLVGYGNAGDVSLGAGDDEAVARFSLFEGSRIRVQPLSRQHRITINDKHVGRKIWANPGDDIRIDGKLVKLS